MPPEPHAGSRILPLNGSMIWTMSRTIRVGVKYSPPLAPSAIANLPRKYSYTLPKASPSMLPRLALTDRSKLSSVLLVRLLICSRQDAPELRILLLDGGHGVVDGATEGV